MNTHFKRKASDCILYSQDGVKFNIHKELFCQTNFLRKLLLSTNNHYCDKLEVLCPCSKDELSYLVNFLYKGEIECAEEFDLLIIQENLYKIFGFPKNLGLHSQKRKVCDVDSDSVTDTEAFRIYENASPIHSKSFPRIQTPPSCVPSPLESGSFPHTDLQHNSIPVMTSSVVEPVPAPVHLLKFRFNESSMQGNWKLIRL